MMWWRIWRGAAGVVRKAVRGRGSRRWLARGVQRGPDDVVGNVA